MPRATASHLCLDPCWYRDPGDGPDLEAIRKDWEIYHYLVAQGVAGRWSHVFRPAVENDDAVWYFQRMDRTDSKGVIITKHAKLGPTYYLICKPKERTASDTYYGGSWDMSKVTTTEVVGGENGVELRMHVQVAAVGAAQLGQIQDVKNAQERIVETLARAIKLC